MSLIRIGDEDAFERLYHRHRPLVFSAAVRLVKHREDAEDVVSEVFWRVFRKISTYDSNRPFVPWLYRIARHESFSLLRRRRARARRFGPMPLREPATECRIERNASFSELATRAQGILRELPADQSRAIRMHDIEDVPAALLSRSLEIPLPTFKSRLRRARRAIRVRLENPFLTDSARS